MYAVRTIQVDVLYATSTARKVSYALVEYFFMA